MRDALGWHFMRSFIRASLITSYKLRKVGIEGIVKAVDRRSFQRIRSDSTIPIADLVGAFLLLRPLYPRTYLCLFDSLCLIHFLIQFQHSPQWVVGVKVEPFGAHCWVQDGDTVLNDTVEAVRQYTPILVA
jgi:hypothetical protein